MTVRDPDFDPDRDPRDPDNEDVEQTNDPDRVVNPDNPEDEAE
jgi:hypothetical protein